MNKETLVMLANKLMFTMEDSEYDTLLVEFDVILKQMDLIVLSSLWEGLPLTPIEAFSVSKTIVATAVDGTVEIVDDGNNGLLVNAREHKELAEKIVYLLENEDVRKKLEKEAYLCYQNKFSFDIFSQGYIRIYECS